MSNIVTDVEFLTAGREEAFAIVEEDFELKLPKNLLLKDTIIQIGDRFKRNFSGVG